MTNSRKINIGWLLLGIIIILLLSSIGIVFYPAMLLLPIVAVALDLRGGFYTATLTMAVTGALATVWLGNIFIPIYSFMLVTGIAAHTLILRKIAFQRALIWMAGASFAGILSGMAIVYFIEGQDIISVLISEMTKSLSAAMDDEAMAGMVAALIDNLNAMGLEVSTVEDIMHYMETVFRLLMPAAIVLVSVYGGTLSYLVPVEIMSYLRAKGKRLPSGTTNLPDPLPVPAWELPRWLGGPLLLLLFTGLLGRMTSNDVITMAAFAVSTITSAAFCYQGLAVVNDLLLRRRWPIAGRIAVSLLALTLLNSILCWFGIFDYLFRFRAFMGRKDDLMNMINKNIRNVPKNDDEDDREDKE